jgi:hypothetical protein
MCHEQRAIGVVGVDAASIFSKQATTNLAHETLLDDMTIPSIYVW